MVSMALNQLLVIIISLYIVSDMNARYARVSSISPPISDIYNLGDIPCQVRATISMNTKIRRERHQEEETAQGTRVTKSSRERKGNYK